MFIYIYDLSNNLVSNPKLFSDGISPFSVVSDNDLSAKNLNGDLSKRNNWAFQWKVNFNPGSNKQAQEVIFSRGIQKFSHSPIIFNNNKMTQSVTENHLESFLNTILDF